MKKQQNIWRELGLKVNKNHLILFLLVGILLIVIAIPTDTGGIQTVSGTSLESRLEKVLGQMSGVGDVSVMITYQEDEMVQGVAVVAEGGDNSVVVRNITEVVQALFDVDSHKIKVIKGNQTE